MSQATWGRFSSDVERAHVDGSGGERAHMPGAPSLAGEQPLYYRALGQEHEKLRVALNDKTEFSPKGRKGFDIKDLSMALCEKWSSLP